MHTVYTAVEGSSTTTDYIIDKVKPYGATVSFSRNEDNEISNVSIYKFEMSEKSPLVTRMLSIGCRVSEHVGPLLTLDVAKIIVEEFMRSQTLWLDTRLGVTGLESSSSIIRTVEEARLYKYLSEKAHKLGGRLSGSYQPDTGKQFQFHVSRGDYTGREFAIRRSAMAGIELNINRPGFSYDKLTKQLCDRILEEFRTLKSICP